MKLMAVECVPQSQVVVVRSRERKWPTCMSDGTFDGHELNLFENH